MINLTGYKIRLKSNLISKMREDREKLNSKKQKAAEREERMKAEENDEVKSKENEIEV